MSREGLRIIANCSLYFEWENPVLKNHLVLRDSPMTPDAIKEFVSELTGTHRQNFYNLLEIYKRSPSVPIGFGADAQEWYESLPLAARIKSRRVEFAIGDPDNFFFTEFPLDIPSLIEMPDMTDALNVDSPVVSPFFPQEEPFSPLFIESQQGVEEVIVSILEFLG